MKKNEIVITGLGVVSNLEIGAETNWQFWEGGQAVDPHQKNQAFLKDLDLSVYLKKQDPRSLSRISQYVIGAAKMCLKDALIKEDDFLTGGVILGSIIGNLKSQTKFYKGMLERGALGVNPMLYCNTSANAPASQIAIENNMKGLNLSLAKDATSGLDAIGWAYLFLKHNIHQRFLLAGGYEELTAPLKETWLMMNRVPYILGEGIAILCLESLETAISRQTKIYAAISAFTSKSNTSAEVVIESALAEAKLSLTNIDAVFLLVEKKNKALEEERKDIAQLLGKKSQLIEPVNDLGYMGGASSALLVALASQSLYFQKLNGQDKKLKNVLIYISGHDGCKSSLILSAKQ